MTIITKKPLLPLLLMVVMALTRFDHFGSALSLPDASLAVFFLAGMGFGSLWFFVLLTFEAGIIDYLAITQFSVSDFCISPAYAFLIPAYAILWYVGRYCAQLKTMSFSEQTIPVMLLALATSVSFVISNGSFYLLSGRIENFSWTGFVEQFVHYYPPYLASTLCYGLSGLLLARLFKLIPGSGSQTTETTV